VRPTPQSHRLPPTRPRPVVGPPSPVGERPAERLPALPAPPRVGLSVMSGWLSCTAGLVVLSNEEEPFNAHRVT